MCVCGGGGGGGRDTLTLISTSFLYRKPDGVAVSKSNDCAEGVGAERCPARGAGSERDAGEGYGRSLPSGSYVTHAERVINKTTTVRTGH